MKRTASKIIIAAALALTLSLLTACGSSGAASKQVIKVGASSAPHAEILEAVKGEVEKEGYELEIVEFDDYVKPNSALTDGDLDANYFQHQPYLTDYNNKNHTDIQGVLDVHFEPLGIYKGTVSSLGDLKSGDKIGVPNDTTNEARALQLLQTEGIITLKEGAGLSATKADIISNPKRVEIVELEAALVPKSLPDLALGVINGNYALGAGLNVTDALSYESKDSDAAKEYANILAVRKGEEHSAKTEALIKALTSDTAREFIESKYKGAVIPVF